MLLDGLSPKQLIVLLGSSLPVVCQTPAPVVGGLFKVIVFNTNTKSIRISISIIRQKYHKYYWFPKQLIALLGSSLPVVCQTGTPVVDLASLKYQY